MARSRPSLFSFSPSAWRALSLALGFMVLVQWFLISAVLHKRHDTAIEEEHKSGRHPMAAGADLDRQLDERTQGYSNSNINVPMLPINPSSSSNKTYDGVAVTLMLRAPKWFHRRYTVMIHNVLNNLPADEHWGIQLIINDAWLKKDVLPLHPGLKTIMERPDVHVTTLPHEFVSKRKPKQIYKTEWFWNSLMHDRVFMFSGNGAMCANYDTDPRSDGGPRLLSWLLSNYDFVGVPWRQHGGWGGDAATYSLRNRTAMLQVLQDHPVEVGSNEDMEPDGNFFVTRMIKDDAKRNYRVANSSVTKWFGGVDPKIVDGEDGKEGDPQTPLVLAGIMAPMNWTRRETLLGTCPEWRLIFPSLHEPGCFGAHPNADKCRSFICALQFPLPPQGC